MSGKELKKTPLHPVYSEMAGVKLVDFGGWEMPVQFAGGILAEHRAVREQAGLFDVSHMGEIAITGPDAASFLDNLLTNRIAGAEAGRCLYTPMCRPDGGVVDDLLVYVLGEADYLLVVNAANTDKDFAWVSARLADSGMNAEARNTSAEWAQLALQGPKALEMLAPFCEGFDPAIIEYYRHGGMVQVAGIKVLLSRTGYTGEDGFELYCAADDAPRLWDTLIGSGAVPCGLGARDVLRLEARLPLYGHELTDEISPLEAGIGMFVKLDKDGFIGREALAAQKESGIPRRLYGLEMVDPGVAREGYSVHEADGTGSPLGFITSGGKSPILDRFIALALLKRGSVNIGDTVNVMIRGKLRAARVVRTPFYRRSA